jgi:cephalosporin hydroxylase
MNVTFEEGKKENIRKLGRSTVLRNMSIRWITDVSVHKYSYNFTWMGWPFVQFPQDIIAMQEIIWQVQPDLIIETGIAHRGSLIFHVSMLELIGEDGCVLGIDIHIRRHKRIEIEKHRMFKLITMLQGSSVDEELVNRVYEFTKSRKKVLVAPDSNHTYDHVLRELKFYSPLVTRGSYLVVFDTIIEDMPEHFFPDNPWGGGKNPKTAVHEFLRTNKRFVIDKEIESKLLITVAPHGYLKCVGD